MPHDERQTTIRQQQTINQSIKSEIQQNHTQPNNKRPKNQRSQSDSPNSIRPINTSSPSLYRKMASLIIGTSIFAYLKHKEHKAKKAASAQSSNSSTPTPTNVHAHANNNVYDAVPRYIDSSVSPPAYEPASGFGSEKTAEKAGDVQARRRSELERANRVTYFAQ
jgi:hypothetical protein